jgi:hypothetical protein
MMPKAELRSETRVLPGTAHGPERDLEADREFPPETRVVPGTAHGPADAVFRKEPDDAAVKPDPDGVSGELADAESEEVPCVSA